MTKKTPLAAAILGITLGFGTITASATEIDATLAARVNQNVIISDESGETLVKAPGNTNEGTLENNDVLLGALDFITISPPQHTYTQRELTGVFATKVLQQQDTDDDGQTSGGTVFNIIDFEMGAAGSTFWTNQFAGIDNLVDATFGVGTWASIGNSTLGFLFDDSKVTGTDFDRTGGLSELGDASDGLLRGVLGFRDTDDFWIARGPDDISAFGTAGTTETLGDFVFGLSFLAENFSVDFEDTVPASPGSAFTGSPYKPAFPFPSVEFYGTGQLFGRGSIPSSSDFAVYNRVDVNVRPIPEPGALALLGLGIAGLGIARRRKS